MAIPLSVLINKVKHMDITLEAGENGINNLVSWAHMVESVEAISFLHGGEVIFVTGIGMTSSNELLSLVQVAQQKDVSGIVVNIGPYIEVIDEQVKYFCDENQLPLYTVPWRVHLAEILRIFSYSITKNDQTNVETAAAFKNAIAYPSQEEIYSIALSQHNFQTEWKYSCGIIQLQNISGDVLTRLETIEEKLRVHLEHTYRNCVVFVYGERILLITANFTEEQLKTLYQETRRFVLQNLIEHEVLLIGVGRLTKSVRCLYKSYNQARKIIHLQAKDKLSSASYFYSELGVYKLIIGIEDDEILKDYMANTLQPLYEYDEKNGSDLTYVLRKYLENNGSVKETAEELYVHRNTINYKINRINEILDIDLSLTETRTQFLVGYMIKDML